MNSREHILQAVTHSQPPGGSLPVLPEVYAGAHVAETFITCVETIGGLVVRVAGIQAVQQYIETWFPRPNRIIHTLPELKYGEFRHVRTATGHDLETVDLAVLRGEFGVAENGAIWLDDTTLPHRALPFICDHLALLLDESALVPTLHEAYQRLSGNPFSYGVFIAGPSKTADIEQSLVIGAHGARSLTVFLLAHTAINPC
ncbi:LUD domain-containing protein (plasmid) [Spirosoma sp. SC4-14]|uniref:LutC/YkgG family protein n=1 Tax=Spirosoma sp. SC4-14 TaxID=3128900 RepID=UPI0030D0469B